MRYGKPRPEKFGTKMHARRARNRHRFSAPISGTCVVGITSQRDVGPTAGRDRDKEKCLDTCYSVIYTSKTRDQQLFTISLVAADWHEAVVPHSALCGHPFPALTAMLDRRGS